jgi:hypothetical protein
MGVTEIRIHVVVQECFGHFLEAALDRCLETISGIEAA